MTIYMYIYFGKITTFSQICVYCILHMGGHGHRGHGHIGHGYKMRPSHEPYACLPYLSRGPSQPNLVEPRALKNIAHDWSFNHFGE